MDAGMTFARPITDRYFEDYVEGDVHHFGTISVEADAPLTIGGRCLDTKRNLWLRDMA